MDTLPVFMTAVSRAVHRVEAHRIQDAAPRRVPFQKKIGVGMTRAEFDSACKAGRTRHVGLGESLSFVAHGAGLELADWNETIEPVIREETVESPDLGSIAAGAVSGVCQEAHGIDASGDPVVKLVFQAAIQQPDPHDRVIIEGEPPIDLTIRGGVHGDIATSAIVINCTERLMGALPGLHTMMSIPVPRLSP